MIPARRPLEDMVSEIGASILPLTQDVAMRPLSLDLSLPVEALVEPGPDGPRVVADLPRLHTRTDFDLPIARLTLSLAAMAPGLAP